MSRPVRDAGEDQEDFELRVSEWADLEKFRQAARKKVHGASEAQEEIEITHRGPGGGAWVTVEIFVTWEEAGVNGANFDLEDGS